MNNYNPYCGDYPISMYLYKVCETFAVFFSILMFPGA